MSCTPDPTTAHINSGGSGQDSGAYYVSDGTKKPICTETDNTGGTLLVPSGIRFCVLADLRDGKMYLVGMGTDSFSWIQYHQNGVTIEESKSSAATTVGGTTVQCAYTFFNNDDTHTWLVNYTQISPTEQRSIPQIAYDIMFGVSPSRTITLNWSRPADGKVLSTTMQITVSGSSQNTESSSGTSGSGGGGTF